MTWSATKACRSSSQELVVSEYFNYARFGEVVVAAPPNGWDRLYTPTAVVEPGAAAIELANEYKRRILTIDGASTRQNPSSIPHPGNGEPFSLTNRFRGGITGIVDDAFNLYRLQPTAYGEYTAKNPRPADAPDVGGEVQVASFNVLNYFLTLDRGANKCGAALNLDCRGANNDEELQRQRAKILPGRQAGGRRPCHRYVGDRHRRVAQASPQRRWGPMSVAHLGCGVAVQSVGEVCRPRTLAP